MGELEILQKLAQLLKTFHVPYLLTGGYAVTYYGEPRATNDIDFLIEITKENKKALSQILRSLGSGYIFDKNSINSIADQRTEFNAVHEETGIKIDFWIIPHPDFAVQYKRRMTKKISGEFISLTSPEDLILTKLSRCKQIFSERHFRDCVGIWHLQGDKLDKNYLKTEAIKRNIMDLLVDISQ